MNTVQHTIKVNGTTFSYTLVRKKVKNINMRIKSDGSVWVSANALISIKDIDNFVLGKFEWIQKKKSLLAEKQENLYELNENSTEMMLFGRLMTLKYIPAKTNRVSYDSEFIYVQYKEQSDPIKVISKFLNQLAHDVFLDIAQLVEKNLKCYQVPTPVIKIRSMKSRWGSCIPAKEQITLNLKLIHYPIDFIEYVVLHEFVHFIHPDHSKDFYQVISFIMPDYKQRMELVKK